MGLAQAEASAELPGPALLSYLQEFARQASAKHDLFDAMGAAGLDLFESATAGADEQTAAQKIKNRASELKGASPKRAFDDCWNQAAQEVSAKG